MRIYLWCLSLFAAGLAWAHDDATLDGMAAPHGGQLRMAELADEVLLSRSNLTRLVDRLEKAGLIHRELCASDRRGFYAVLTDEGRTTRQKMWPIYRAVIERHVEGQLSAEEADVLQRVFRRLIGR